MRTWFTDQRFPTGLECNTIENDFMRSFRTWIKWRFGVICRLVLWVIFVGCLRVLRSGNSGGLITPGRSVLINLR